MKSRVSIVLAAGASTRMKSKTSKLLHSILGRPIAEWAFRQARWVSPQIVFVVGHQRENSEKVLQPLIEEGVEISFALQEQQRGTADAVRAALEQLTHLDGASTNVFIMPGDAVLLRRETLDALMKNHEQSQAVLTLLTAHWAEPGAYGRVIRDSVGAPEKIVEVKEATEAEKAVPEVNSGFFMVQLSALREGIEEIMSRSSTAEFYLTDLVQVFRKKGYLIRAEVLRDRLEMSGVNSPSDLALAQKIVQRRINEGWMNAGVRMTDPEQTWIEPEVQLEADVALETGVHLKGRTTVAAESHIGPYAILENCEISSQVRVEAFCHLRDAKVGRQSVVGPFARLRLGAELSEKVHIGNFVEVKKSKLEKGVKANHLTYLGDAEVGEDSNIGCGTITCNYDGFQKHSTKIGARVFVGSNTSFVAPVTIGSDAIVGAGSVITKDVPAEALAVERADQKTIPSGAKRFRSRRGQ